jgi:hypothetical protein
MMVRFGSHAKAAKQFGLLGSGGRSSRPKKTISMAWVLPALLAGEKTCTRRTWTDDYAARFKKGDLVDVLDKDRHASGKVVARIRLTADPVKQHISEMLDTDYKAEGFLFMRNNGLTSDFPFGFSRAGFNNCKKIDRMYWVIRFEKVDVKKKVSA